MGISIIGAGSIGQALAKAFSEQGIPVYIGVPDPASYRQPQAELLPNIEIGHIPDAIEKNNLIFLALPYEVAMTLAKGIPDWQNKILVDTTNPLLPTFDGLSVGTHTSGAEEIAKQANHARVVKAFNALGAETLADREFEDGKPLLPVASDDEDARHQVIDLAEKIGFDAMEAGTLSASRYIEPLAMLWLQKAVTQGEGRHFAFSRIKR